MAFQVSGDLEQRMVRRFQRLIRKNGLIDTGNLWRSIDITATVDDSGRVSVRIFSVDYLKYLDERFQLTSDFVNAAQFDRIVRDIYAEWVPYMLNRFPMLSGFEKVLSDVRGQVEVEIVN